jgi:hypothetical protein
MAAFGIERRSDERLRLRRFADWQIFQRLPGSSLAGFRSV